MQLILWLLTSLCVSQTLPSQGYTVGYNHRSVLINDKPILLVAGAIHYPRSTPKMWPYLLQKAKEAGLNTIDTYVFWNLHEPIQGEYDFSTGLKNLPLFLTLAREADLFVNLRIGPYVCAEWNLGGFPAWLIQKPGLAIRTFNEPYMIEMEVFIKKTLQVVDPFLARSGGPIILLQMENEYGNVEWKYGFQGLRYITWAANLAKELDVGVPWIMCQQDLVPVVLKTCNGFYCDNWISYHQWSAPTQPAMFTELWSGWFQFWGQAKSTRPVQDLAFSATRFVARGGN